jgi:hypothetical protein
MQPLGQRPAAEGGGVAVGGRGDRVAVGGLPAQRADSMRGKPEPSFSSFTRSSRIHFPGASRYHRHASLPSCLASSPTVSPEFTLPTIAQLVLGPDRSLAPSFSVTMARMYRKNGVGSTATVRVGSSVRVGVPSKGQGSGALQRASRSRPKTTDKTFSSVGKERVRSDDGVSSCVTLHLSTAALR